jgi:hypothetical protein
VRWLPVLRSPSAVAELRSVDPSSVAELLGVDSTAEGGAGNGADAALAGIRRPEAKAVYALIHHPPHSTPLRALRSDEPHRRKEGADAAGITSEQGQMGDVGVRADEEVWQGTSFLPARSAVFFKGFPGLKGGVEQ